MVCGLPRRSVTLESRPQGTYPVAASCQGENSPINTLGCRHPTNDDKPRKWARRPRGPATCGGNPVKTFRPTDSESRVRRAQGKENPACLDLFVPVCAQPQHEPCQAPSGRGVDPGRKHGLQTGRWADLLAQPGVPRKS